MSTKGNRRFKLKPKGAWSEYSLRQRWRFFLLLSSWNALVCAGFGFLLAAVTSTLAAAIGAGLALLGGEAILFQRIHHPDDGNVRSLARVFVWTFAIGAVLYVVGFMILARLVQ